MDKKKRMVTCKNEGFPAHVANQITKDQLFLYAKQVSVGYVPVVRFQVQLV